MSRISRPQLFMEMARAASKRSTCFRLNVGALVVRDNRPISVGWNGHSPGAPHCTGNSCPGVVPGKCGTIHAEVNAIKHAPNIRGPWDLYVTDSPCVDCAETIRRSKVNRVFFENLYRINDHLLELPHIGIEVYRVLPSGYVVDFTTGQVVELA